MSNDRQYFDDPSLLAPHLDADEVPDDDLWAGDDLAGYSDDNLPDDDEDDAVGSRGDQLIGLFDTSSEDDRREFFGSTIFQDWLAALLKKNGVKPVAETAAPPSRVQPSINPAALRLAAKAVAIWEETYP